MIHDGSMSSAGCSAATGHVTCQVTSALPQDAMLMGADYYESEQQRQSLFDQGRLPIGVGDNSEISNTIVDKNARIGKNCKITNQEGLEESNQEAKGFYIRSGIVTILRNAEIKDGTVI